MFVLAASETGKSLNKHQGCGIGGKKRIDPNRPNRLGAWIKWDMGGEHAGSLGIIVLNFINRADRVDSHGSPRSPDRINHTYNTNPEYTLEDKACLFRVELPSR